MTAAADRVTALCEQLSGREANGDSRLDGDLGLDSLDRIQLAMDIEDALGLHIPDEDVDREELGTVGGLIEYVERRLKVDGQ